MRKFKINIIALACLFVFVTAIPYESFAQTDTQSQKETQAEKQDSAQQQDPETKGEKAKPEQESEPDSKKETPPPKSNEKQDPKEAAPKSADSEQNSEKQKQADEEKNKAEEPRQRGSRRSNRSNERNDTYSKRDSEFVSLFDSITASATSSTVRIMNGDSEIALGAIVDPDGFIVTKASEMKGEIACVLPDGTSLKAKVFGIDPDSDLALLKVEANNLAAANWSSDPPPRIGQWLATTDGSGKSHFTGVVSVDVRPIPPGGGFLGIMPAIVRGGTGVRISQVTSGMPADKAGVLVNDIIVKIDNVEIPTVEQLRETLKNYSEGDAIELTVKRGDEELVLPLRLSDSQTNNPLFSRSNTQNEMGSKLSRRRLDFPLAFQHDSQLQDHDCGGPIVDLSGRVVGINIARAGRVKSFALPVEVVVPIIEELKSGKFSPAVVNKTRIEEVNEELKVLKENLETLPTRKQTLESKITSDEARREELKRLIDDMQARMKTLDESAAKSNEELESVDKILQSAEANKMQLEKELETLTTGRR